MGADNPQETKFSLTRRSAYLLGFVLADGSLEKSRHGNYSRLTLDSIDYDLLTYAQSIVGELVGKLGRIKERDKTLGNHDKFRYRVSDKELVTWLAGQTQDKGYVPSQIFNTDKVRKTAFVAGLLDGDGWISVQEKALSGERNGREWKMQMGVASTFPWVLDLKRLFQRERVKTGILQVRETKYGKRINSFTINMESYLRWGGYLRCKRKAERLNRYRRWLREKSNPQRLNVRQLELRS